MAYGTLTGREHWVTWGWPAPAPHHFPPPSVGVLFGLLGCAHLGQMGLGGLLDGQSVPMVHKGQK